MTNEKEQALKDCVAALEEAAALSEQVNNQVWLDISNVYEMMKCAGELSGIINNMAKEARGMINAWIFNRNYNYYPCLDMINLCRSKADEWEEKYDNWNQDCIFPTSKDEGQSGADDLAEMVRDAAKTLELALFGDLDKMADDEKTEALNDIYASLMAELYGTGIDPEKVHEAEKEIARRKAERADENNLPFQ